MSVISVNGLPGVGKTLISTHLALKHFKKENTILKRLFRKIRKKEVWNNNTTYFLNYLQY